MTKPAFIVDGYQEKLIIQQLCPGTPVKRLDCNGDDVAISAAVKRMASLIRLMKGRYYPIIIVYDRESRKESSKNISEKIDQGLRNEGISDQLVIGVPDRTIENWILADWPNVQEKGRLNSPALDSAFEGNHGKSIIKKLLPKDGQYHETIEGVEWFISANPNTMAKSSQSFHEFVSSLAGVPCTWLSKEDASVQARLMF